MKSSDAKRDLLMTRAGRAHSFIDCITWWDTQHRSELEQEESAGLMQDMESRLAAFHDHPLIDEWLLQYQPTARGARLASRHCCSLGDRNKGKARKPCPCSANDTRWWLIAKVWGLLCRACETSTGQSTRRYCLMKEMKNRSWRIKFSFRQAPGWWH